MLLWVLWRHQGSSSEIGQPIRRMLCIDPHEMMTESQVAIAKDVGERLAAPPTPPEYRTRITRGPDGFPESVLLERIKP